MEILNVFEAGDLALLFYIFALLGVGVIGFLAGYLIRDRAADKNFSELEKLIADVVDKRRVGG